VAARRLSIKHAALWPLVLYWVVMLASFGLFSRFAREVHSHEDFSFDVPLLRRLHEARSETITDIVLWVTQFGSTWFLIGFSILAVAILAKISRRAMVFYVLGVGGAGALNQFAKVLFARERPAFTELPAVYELDSFSFPSGHAMATGALFLTLYLIARRLARPHRWTAAVIALVLTVAVGATRVYLGVHYPSDVIGGWALGCLWVLGVNWWYRRAYRLYPHAPDPVEDPALDDPPIEDVHGVVEPGPAK
jgi:membrane-associated phospholipid phosphatase